MALTAEDLLMGATATHTIEVPPEVLAPGGGEAAERAATGHPAGGPSTVVLRPLQLTDVSRIDRAGGDDPTLVSVLMVARSLVEPAVTVDDVQRMHAGLVEFLLEHVNRISGLHVPSGELAELARAPLANACFVLAREFGWTPDECTGLTVGQVLLYLEMLGQGGQE